MQFQFFMKIKFYRIVFSGEQQICSLFDALWNDNLPAFLKSVNSETRKYIDDIGGMKSKFLWKFMKFSKIGRLQSLGETNLFPIYTHKFIVHTSNRLRCSKLNEKFLKLVYRMKLHCCTFCSPFLHGFCLANFLMITSPMKVSYMTPV